MSHESYGAGKGIRADFANLIENFGPQNLLIGSKKNRATKNVIGSKKNRSDRIRSVFFELIF
jgi:hypothetical protein